MTTRCDNCKRPIINPVDHEFCRAYRPRTTSRIMKVVGPVIKKDEYVAPTEQGPISHQVAPLSERPRLAKRGSMPEGLINPDHSFRHRGRHIRRAIYRATKKEP